jgi:transposase-like protein
MEEHGKSDELKRELAAARIEGQRFFPANLKERALAYARERWQAGVTLSAVARELGLQAGTLAFWQGKRTPAKAVRPVVVRPSERTYTVRAGRSARVDGLTLNEVAALLEKLG